MPTFVLSTIQHKMAQENASEGKYENKRMVTYISPALQKEVSRIAEERFGIKKDATILKMAIKLFIQTYSK